MTSTPRTAPFAPPPRGGQLWLSRPPFLLLVHVLAVDSAGASITYEILDRDGSPIAGPVQDLLDASWWRNVQLLTKRDG